MSVHLAAQRGVDNYSVLVSHVLVPPAIEAIVSSPTNRVDGFLAAGHVCSVMGTTEYEALVSRYHVPIVVTGFEPLDVLDGIRRVVTQLEQGQALLENAYARVVSVDGNVAAQAMVEDVFELCDREWRGIGELPASGWRLSDRYRDFDADRRFGPSVPASEEPAICRSGEVLRGLIKPNECEAFANQCTPRNPLGAPMVSNEGACAAYYQYRRLGGTPIEVPVD